MIHFKQRPCWLWLEARIRVKVGQSLEEDISHLETEANVTCKKSNIITIYFVYLNLHLDRLLLPSTAKSLVNKGLTSSYYVLTLSTLYNLNHRCQRQKKGWWGSKKRGKKK